LHAVSALQAIDADRQEATNREYKIGLEGLRSGEFDVAEAAFTRAWELSLNIQYMIAVGGECSLPINFGLLLRFLVDWL
jgi:hypothetical protein